MPFPNEHALRLRPPTLFDKNTFRRTKGGTLFGGKLVVPATIGMIWAKLKDRSASSDSPILQALRFDKSKWTVATAKAWIRKNLPQGGTFEPSSVNGEVNSATITDDDIAKAILMGDNESYESGDEILDTDIDVDEIEFQYTADEEIDEVADVAATIAQLMFQADVGLPEEVIDSNPAVTDSAHLADSDDTDPEDTDETQRIDNIEIFATGKWGTESYDKKDLDLLVKNFNALSDEIKPPNKLGHGKQGLLASAGLPAAGWITALRRVGDKLVADMSDVPKRIARIIKNRGYKRVSVEIYNNYQDKNGERRGLVLKALAFLGGDIPAVKTLKDMEVLYADELNDVADNPYRRFTLMADLTKEPKETLDNEEVEEVDTETPELKDEDEEQEEEVEEEETTLTPEEKTPAKASAPKPVTVEMSAADKKRIDDLEKKLATATELVNTLHTKNIAQEKSIAMSEHKQFMDGLIGDGKFPPALKDKAVAMLSQLSGQDETVLTYSEGEESVETNPLALFKDLLSGLSTIIEMGEKAHGDDPKKPGTGSGNTTDPAYANKEGYDVEGAELVDAVSKYMEENPDIDMAEALIQVSREQS